MLDLKNILAVLLLSAILLLVWIGVLMVQALNTPVTNADFPGGAPDYVVRKDLLDTIKAATFLPAGDGGLDPADIERKGKARKALMDKVAENGAASIPALREVIGSEKFSYDAKEQAIQALMWVQQEEAVHILGDVLMTHKDDGVRALAAKILGRKASSKAMHYLLAALEKEKSEFVKVAALDATGRFGDEASLEKLGALLLTDPSRLVRRMAATAIGKLKPEQGGGSSQAVGYLMQALLYDPNPHVRIQCVRSLGAIRARDLKSLLRNALKEERDPEVRRALEGALDELKPKKDG